MVSKRTLPCFLILIIVGILAVSAITSIDAQPDVQTRESLWKLVAEANKKGLPKTAIGHLKQIVASAVKDKDYDEAVKAIGEKIALEATIQGNKSEEKITRLQAELKEAVPEMKPAMEALLANWYWHYFQQNRWRFMQRTQTSQAPGEDLQTWDLKRIYAEIDSHFEAALDSKSLQTTPIQDFEELIEKGNVPDRFRPTMYDFVAQDALAFYSSGEQAGAAAEDEFILSADSNVFAVDGQFLAWQVEQNPTDSPQAKALRLMQQLMKFHQKDDDRTAYLDVDLQRLSFGNAMASGEEKNARYKSALQRWSNTNSKHSMSSRALWLLAEVLRQEGDLVKARETAKVGLQRFPDSFGGLRCFNTIEQIEAKSIQVNVERVWNAPFPDIQVNYKNVEQVHFRAIAYDWDARLGTGFTPENLNRAQRLALLNEPAVKTWTETLEPTEDFHNRVVGFAAPKDLKPGSYFLLASPDMNFARSENYISFTSFWVSDLALIVRSRYGQAKTEGFVLDADSGEPLKGAKVRLWENSNRTWRSVGSLTTDADGFFTSSTPHQKQLAVHVRLGDQALSSNQQIYSYKTELELKPFTRTMFFTDRSLYRPGQTVHFKGLAISVSQDQDSYEVLRGQKVTVTFRDQNNKEIEKHSFISNDFGSFSGSVTTPRSGLTGGMRLVVEAGPQGAANFNVEEYKRPKFKVKIDPPKTPGVLNADVALTGIANAYTGAPIDGAKVRWRVVRGVHYPAWWSWKYWWYPSRNSKQEIAHGIARTKPDGTFDVSFHAKPDPTVSESDEPTFQYTINADVTDTTGETRSAKHVINVGFTALKATLSVSNWQTNDKPVAINLRTTTLDGVDQNAEGVLKVYRVKQPQKVGRTEFLPYSYGNYRGGKSLPPKPDPSNVNSWPLGEVVHEAGVTTESGNASVSVKLGEGLYRARFETADRFGKPVTAIVPIRVLAPDSNKLTIRVPSIVDAESWVAKPGDDFEALWGSGYDKARAYVEIEHRYKVIEKYWTKPGITQEIIKQKVTAAMRGGFVVRVTMVRENRAYMQQQTVSVPWTNKDLQVRWEHFRSKLKPGEDEKWTAIITGPAAEYRVAEMVAGLYDASLDAYKPHSWQTHFNVFRHNRSNCNSWFTNQLQYFQRVEGSWTVPQKNGSMTYRHYPITLTTNLFGYGYGRGGRVSKYSLGKSAERQTSRRELSDSMSEEKNKDRSLRADERGASGSPPALDLSNVPARANLNETAFFFPHLVSNKNGEVKLEFTMPEALTEWKFLGFAHDGNLSAGFIQSSTVTAKKLMVQPNPPRFVREGDQLEFTVKVTNQSAQGQSGKVRLTFADARTDSDVNKLLANIDLDREFEIA
ncbi:MAG: 5-hydroxyisourate hydrolase-like protein (transthyretin family), partial [Pirellulaceae bacterium]